MLGGMPKLYVYCQCVRLWPRLKHHCCGTAYRALPGVKVRSHPAVYLNFLPSHLSMSLDLLGRTLSLLAEDYLSIQRGVASSALRIELC